MDTSFSIPMQIGQRAAPGMPPYRILWRCPLCMAYHPLPHLWTHLLVAHGWDRDVYEATRQGGAANRKHGVI